MNAIAVVNSIVALAGIASHRSAPYAAPQLNVLMLFGFLAAFFTCACWVYQRQSRSMTMAFAIGLAAMAAYGFLAGTWPLGVVVSVWSASVFWRWQKTVPARREKRGLRAIATRGHWDVGSRITRIRSGSELN